MKIIPRNPTSLFCSIAAALVLMAPVAQADLIGDAKTTLNLRNFYFNRDNEGADTNESWSQAAHLYVQSGYTEGEVGFGIDLAGFGAARLDGKFDRTNNLPHDGGNIKDLDSYGRGGGTLKVRYSNSELKVGLLEPITPVISRDFSRVIPQTFEGAMVTVDELEDVKFTAGHLWKTSPRHQSSQRKLKAGAESDGLSFFGAEIKWDDNWSSSYWTARLTDVYDQHYVSSDFKQNLGEDIQLFSSVSAFDTKKSGNNKTIIDNQAYQLKVGVGFNGHKMTASYQKMEGQHGFPFLGDSTPQPYLFHFVTNQAFADQGEESIQARYDFDFAAIGIPGLNLMARYIRGSGIEGKTYTGEWERDTDVGYTFQQGPLKDLSFLLRTASVRNNAGLSRQEFRFITSYPFNF